MYLLFKLFLLILLHFVAVKSQKSNGKDGVAVMLIYKVEKVYINETFGDFNLTVSRVSRKDFAISFYFKSYVEMGDKLSVHFHVDALYSNTFRRTPLTVTRNMCSFVKSEYVWVRDDLQKYGHVPYSCPIAKDLYYVNNYILDASKVPYLPWKEIKVNIDIWSQENSKAEKISISSLALYIKNNQDYVKLMKDV